MNKASLRKLYIEKRKAFSLNDISVLSGAIVKNFGSIFSGDVKFIHLYYPITEKSEVDTLRLASWLRLWYPEVKLVLSKSNFKDNSLSHIVWQHNTPLTINKYGITEPEDGFNILPPDLDMIIVPLLAYDLVGNRVGYGKGFYDKFLAECRPDALKVGFSFFPPEVKIDDVNPHDIPINICITPQKVWKFG